MIVLEVLFLVAVTGGLIFTIVTLVAIFSESDALMDDDAAQINFMQFRVLYDIAPGKWILHNGFVTYQTETSQDYFFSIFDKLKYKRWKKAKDKAAKKTREMRKKKAVTEAMLKDIENWKKRNGVEISTTDVIEDATEREKISLMEAFGWKSDC